jgi:hypothetical protein
MGSRVHWSRAGITLILTLSPDGPILEEALLEVVLLELGPAALYLETLEPLFLPFID